MLHDSKRHRLLTSVHGEVESKDAFLATRRWGTWCLSGWSLRGAVRGWHLPAFVHS